MLKQKRISVLSLSPCFDDHEVIADILKPYQWPIQRASSLPGARPLLRSRQIGLIICERDLIPHSWKDLLAEVAALPRIPLVIVTSPHADDYLWAEALNLGAYDVLRKPFDSAEVTRVIGLARLHWENQFPVSLVEETLAAS